MMNTIKSTKDYSRFNIMAGNRPINERYLSKLTLSIMRNNLLSANPILVNSEMFVIDGQHRLEVAKNNDLEIFYIVLDVATIDTVIELNANLRAWTAKDYLESYATRGNKAYQWLLEYMNNYELTMTQALSFIYGGAGGEGTNGHMQNIIRSGRFNPTQLQQAKAEKRAKVLYEMRPFINLRGLTPLSIIRGIVVIDEEGDSEKLIEGMREKSALFVPHTQIREGEAQLREYLK